MKRFLIVSAWLISLVAVSQSVYAQVNIPETSERISIDAVLAAVGQGGELFDSEPVDPC